MTTLTEAAVEQAALDWLEGLGWSIAHGPDISDAEHDNYDQIVLEQRLTNAIDSLNPDLPHQARDDTLRKLIRPEGATVETRNRSFHRMLINDVEIQYPPINPAQPQTDLLLQVPVSPSLHGPQLD